MQRHKLIALSVVRWFPITGYFFFYVQLEVYAAREKNGIYIPRDRYLQEEAEKKV